MAVLLGLVKVLLSHSIPSSCPLHTKPLAEFCNVLCKTVHSFTDLLSFKLHGMNAM